MRAITIHEPYVSAILALRKRYETRSWSTSYRGDVVLCTAKAFTAADKKLALSDYCKDVWGEDFDLGYAVGCVPCESLLNDISEVERALGYWPPDHFAFRLTNVRRFGYPIPVRGQLGLWSYRGELPTKTVLDIEYVEV